MSAVSMAFPAGDRFFGLEFPRRAWTPAAPDGPTRSPRPATRRSGCRPGTGGSRPTRDPAGAAGTPRWPAAVPGGRDQAGAPAGPPRRHPEVPDRSL